MLVSVRKVRCKGMEEIRIRVDYETSGYNELVANNNGDIIKAVLDALDSSVKEIIIKKEPTHNVSEENT